MNVKESLESTRGSVGIRVVAEDTRGDELVGMGGPNEIDVSP